MARHLHIYQKCGMIAKANIAAFVVKNCKEKGKIMSKQNLAVILEDSPLSMRFHVCPHLILFSALMHSVTIRF